MDDVGKYALHVLGEDRFGLVDLINHQINQLVMSHLCTCLEDGFNLVDLIYCHM